MSISNKPLIIGLAGTLNAGKDILANALADQEGFLHISTSDMARQLKKEAFGDAPEALLVRGDPYITSLRQENPGFLVDAAYEIWMKKKDICPAGCVASGIRAIGEAQRVKQLGGIIVFVDATPEVRHRRAQLRARDKNDQVSLAEFIASENAEMSDDRTDVAAQNLTAVREMADIVIDNSATSIEEFVANAQQTLHHYIQ